MSDSPRRASDLAAGPHHEDAADRAARLWDGLARPDLDRFLEQAGPLSPRELAAVLRDDQCRCWQSDQRFPTEFYLRRYPDAASDPEAALDLIYGEYLLRERLELSPDLGELLLRFPEHAGMLRDQVELHWALADPGFTAVAGTSGRSAQPAPEGATPPERSAAGPVLPGYEILDELGRGAMGVVYRARQTGLNRTVAVKVILTPDADDPDHRQRFRHEAEAVALLRHPNVVRLHTCGEAAGHLYLVLEYLAGGSLAQRCGGKPQPPDQAARLVETLARAVHACHEQGIVHRDLKPANILLGPGGVPMVADFGLARRNGTPAQTRTGAVLGTPSYMAPEQAEGQSKHVGPACDTYALGAILYELLTGRPPFRADTTLDTLVLVLTQEPTPPAQVYSGVPAALESVCLRCLRKQPGQRYATALELAEDLARFLRGEAVHGAVVRNPARSPRWRTFALALPLVAVVCLALVAVLVLGWSGSPRSTGEDEMSTGGVTILQPLEPPEGERPRPQPPVPQPPASRPPEAERPPPPAPEPAEPVIGRVEKTELRYLNPVAKFTLGSVIGIAFVDGGKRFACAGVDGRLRLVDVTSGVEVRRPDGHRQRIGALAASADGTQFLSGGKDGLVRLWDVRDWRCLLEIKSSGTVIHSVAFAPDGKAFVTGDGLGKVRLRETGTGRDIWEFDLGGEPVKCVAFSPDGLFVAAGGQRARLVWADTGKEFFTATGPEGTEALAFSPDAAALALVSGSGHKLALWETASGLPRTTSQSPTGPVRSLAFSADGRFVAFGSEGDVSVFSRLDWREVFRCVGSRSRVTALAFAPDRPLLLGAGEDGLVRSWNLDTVSQEDRKPVAIANAEQEQYRRGLTAADATEAWRSVGALTRDPESALRMLDSRAGPARRPDLEGVEGLLRSAQPRIRRAGLAELEQAGELADPVLRELLRQELPEDVRSRLDALLTRARAPIRDVRRLYALRELEVLQLIDSPDARAKIGKLAGGAPGAFLTQRATAAHRRHLERLLFAD